MILRLVLCNFTIVEPLVTSRCSEVNRRISARYLCIYRFVLYIILCHHCLTSISTGARVFTYDTDVIRVLKDHNGSCDADVKHVSHSPETKRQESSSLGVQSEENASLVKLREHLWLGHFIRQACKCIKVLLL